MIETKLNIIWNSQAKDVVEVFDFKDKQAQYKFFQATEKTNDLLKIFESEKPLGVQTKKFVKHLNGFIQENFKKVKITPKQTTNYRKCITKEECSGTKQILKV